MQIIDSHAHLEFPQFDEDRDAMLERAREAGIEALLAIGSGTGPDRLNAAIPFAEQHDWIYATVGIHPHDAGKASKTDFDRLAELLSHPKVIALGEIGLDYHYDLSPRETQTSVFIQQMEIAAAARKPIVIHTREAWDDTAALLEQHWKPHGIGGIMHCFSGGPADARRTLDLGFYLSFGGIVTFPKAIDVQAAAKAAPADRILVETDAPYLAPVPKRGKRNEPALVVHTARKLADLRGQSLEEVSHLTSENLRRLLLSQG